MDIWDKKKRSEVMSKIRSKNTKPEVLLRKALFAKGYRYRINDKRLPGKPDIVFPKYKTVVFVNGCFWHGHEDCTVSHIPKTNSKFWEDKFVRNRERDKMNGEKLLALGWHVITVWECEISNKTISSVADRIIEALHSEVVEPSPLRVKIYEEIDDTVTLIAEDIIRYDKKEDIKGKVR